MDMNECRLVVASNLIRLRTAAGLTQAELGEKLNYSDKSVSKWERGAALPDVLVLHQLGQLFGVTVDYFLSEHGDKESPRSGEVPEGYKNYPGIIKVTIAGIWTAAVLAFVILWMLDIVTHNTWLIFAGAVVVSLIVWLVMNSVWCHGKHNDLIVMALVCSLFVLLFLIFWDWNIWQLFLVLIPAEALTYLSFHIKRKH